MLFFFAYLIFISVCTYILETNCLLVMSICKLLLLHVLAQITYDSSFSGPMYTCV